MKPTKTTESTPDLDIVEGTDTDIGPAGTVGYPLQVKVVGPVYTQEMPAANSADGSFSVGSNSGDTQAPWSDDPRRKSLVIWCENFPIYFGTVKNMVQAGTSAHLPAGGSASIAHHNAVYVRGDGGTALVSYISEQWAD